MITKTLKFHLPTPIISTYYYRNLVHFASLTLLLNNGFCNFSARLKIHGHNFLEHHLFDSDYSNFERQVEEKKYHPVGGTIFNQLRNFNRLHDYMTDLARKYKTYRLITPFRSEVYTSDPANVEYILKTKFENYGKGWHNYSILKDLLGDGIFAVDGEKWREQRKVSSHEFSTRVLRDVSTIIFGENAVKLAKIVSEAVISKQPMDIQELFMKSTLDSIFKVAFGVNLDTIIGSNEQGARFSHAFDNASEITAWRYLMFFGR